MHGDDPVKMARHLPAYAEPSRLPRWRVYPTRSLIGVGLNFSKTFIVEVIQRIGRESDDGVHLEAARFQELLVEHVSCTIHVPAVAVANLTNAHLLLLSHGIDSMAHIGEQPINRLIDEVIIPDRSGVSSA